MSYTLENKPTRLEENESIQSVKAHKNRIPLDPFKEMIYHSHLAAGKDSKQPIFECGKQVTGNLGMNLNPPFCSTSEDCWLFHTYCGWDA